MNKLIEKYENIVIFHHINPDGDCLGSQFGLKELILDNFKNKNVYVIGNSQNIFPFMNFLHDKIPPKNILNNALGIVVDANYLNRIENSELIIEIGLKEILRIDHHPVDDDLNASMVWRDDSFAATCEQIAFFAIKNGWIISPKTAKFLYLGIVTDSGFFFYEKTSRRTHEVVGILLEKFDFFEVHNTMRNRSLKSIKFQAEVLNNFKTKENVAYYILEKPFSKIYDLEESEKNRVDFLSNIEGFNIWIFFIENEDGSYRVRLRSNKYPINVLAKEYGGGGHSLAAGCVIKNKKFIGEIIKKASELK